MVIELIPAKLAFRGLSDEEEEDPTVVESPDLDDEDDEDEDDVGLPTDDTDEAEPLEQ